MIPNIEELHTAKDILRRFYKSDEAADTSHGWEAYEAIAAVCDDILPETIMMRGRHEPL